MLRKESTKNKTVAEVLDDYRNSHINIVVKDKKVYADIKDINFENVITLLEYVKFVNLHRFHHRDGDLNDDNI